jgi:hypothetical protein
MSVSVFSRADISVQEKIPKSLYLQKGVNYNSVILARQTRQYFPDTQSDVVSNSNSVINIKMNEAGDDYIDPATCMLIFNAKVNKQAVDGTIKGMFQDGICWFERCELWIGGQMLEENFHCHELLSSLTYHSVDSSWYTSKSAYDQNYWRYAYKAGRRADSLLYGAAMPTITALSGKRHITFDEVDVYNLEKTSHNNRTFVIPLSVLFGLFRVSQFLSSDFLKSLEVKLYLNSYQNACVELEDASAAAADVPTAFTRKNYRLESTNLDANGINTTGTFTISSIKITSDLMTLHPSYVSSMKKLSAGSGFIIMLESWLYSSEQILGSPQSVTIQRGISSLKDIWVLLRRNVLELKDSSNESSSHGLTSYVISIGSKNFTHSIKSIEEAYVEVLKSLNVCSSVSHHPVVNDELYRNLCFAIGQNVELVSVEATPSQISTKINGNNIRIDVELSLITDPFILYNRTAAQVGYKPLLQAYLHHDVSIFVRNNTIEIIK